MCVTLCVCGGGGGGGGLSVSDARTCTVTRRDRVVLTDYAAFSIHLPCPTQ